MRASGAAHSLRAGGHVRGVEDFSFFAQKAPGLFIFLGGSPKGTDLTKVAYNHSPRFYVDESGLLVGVRSLANLTVDYLMGGSKQKQ